MIVEDIILNEPRFQVKLSALNEEGKGPYTYSFNTDEPLHQDIEEKFSYVIETYKDIMKKNPKLIKVTIEKNSVHSIKEYIFDISYNKNGIFSIKEWGTYIDLEPLEEKLFESFLMDQIIYGKIHLSLEKRDENEFYYYTDLIKEKEI